MLDDARSDRAHVLSLGRPAGTWLECLPLGNGTVGVMADGGMPRGRLWLNHEHGWSGSPASESAAAVGEGVGPAALARARRALSEGRPTDAEGHLARLQGRYSQAFLPMAGCDIRVLAPTGGAYERRLDLATGIHEVGSGALRQRTVVSRVHGVVALETSADVEISLDSPLRVLAYEVEDSVHTLRVRWPSDVPPVHEVDYPDATWDPAPGAALEGAVVARTARTAAGGTVVVLALETTFTAPGTPPVGTSEDAARVARERVDRACALDPEDVFGQAAADHGRLFGRSGVEITTAAAAPPADLAARLEAAFTGNVHPWRTDPGLAGLLYDMGRYLLIASARPGGLPPTLQGIWNHDLRPPWSSNFTLNINAEMNHWACHPTSLQETAEPLLDLVEALSVAGARTARRLYDAPGWCAHHNTDAWLYSSPVGEGHGQARWSAWPMAGPWLVTQLWSAVEFGGGDLRRLWPIARGAAEFALAWHHRNESGRWVTSPATSPENVHRTEDGEVVALDETTAMDQQLLHALFGIVAELADRLGLEDEVARRCAERRSVLAPQPPVAADGTLLEWAADREEVERDHRHVSHLWGLYPGWSAWDAEGLAGAAETLGRRGDDSSGWSLVWKMCLWARLGRGDKVSDLARLLFRHVPTDQGPEAGGLYPNLFAAHPPFQIDANLGYPAALAETLVQSHDDIRLLPALPPELADGRAFGLLARPGVVVDLEWAQGRLVRARLSAERPTRATVRYEQGAVDLEIGTDPCSVEPGHFRTGLSSVPSEATDVP